MSSTTTAPPDLAEAETRERRLGELGVAFRRVFRTLNRIRGRDTHLAGSELSHAQFELLIELQERGELSAGQLAAAARLAPGTVTEMLDGLAESGHVERARSERDRRVVVSRLTELGEEQIMLKRQAWKARWDGALEGVSDRDLRAAARVLERLGAMFEETAPAESRTAGERGGEQGTAAGTTA